MTIYNILEEFNQTNSSNDKLAVMRKYKDHEQFLRVLRLTYDKVKFAFGIRKIPTVNTMNPQKSLDEALDFLEFQLATREITGNTAINELALLMAQLNAEDLQVIRLIIGRDLKINFGRTQILKVVPGLITKPNYMRCSSYSQSLASRLQWPCYCQLKADGRFVNVIVSDTITFQSRSGEEQEFPELSKAFASYPQGVYHGELLVSGETDRAISNGMINSSEPPHHKIYCQLWDYVGLQAFSVGSPIPYQQRFNLLKGIVNEYESDHIEMIPSVMVKDIQEALSQTSKWMSQGYEGSILKCPTLTFKNGTSKQQIKLKVVADCTVRITGFTEGTGKRQSTFGAITFQTDDDLIQGQCSGFTDSVLEDFNSRRAELIGKLMDVTFNDMTKASESESYALSHPRFSGLRTDRESTDTLENVINIIEMAKELS